MIKITEEEYKEYQLYKSYISNVEKQKIWDSVNSIKNLEDDIDVPIKNCVAKLALLNCQPVFSCCGYDYQNQHIHKYHQYGLPYIIIKENADSRFFVQEFSKYGLQDWSFEFRLLGRMKLIYLQFLGHPKRGNPAWITDKNNAHFSENLVDGILHLENVLTKFQHLFMDEVIVEDTNETWKKKLNKYWEYNYKNPWIIKKEDYL